MRRLAALLLCAACVGSPMHSTMHYNSVQSAIADNNRHLIGLHVGMPEPEVLGAMGQPERSEGYAWGKVLLYRTAMTSGIYGTTDPDFTPVVLDPSGVLVGWGRHFFADQVRRYELTVRQQ